MLAAQRVESAYTGFPFPGAHLVPAAGEAGGGGPEPVDAGELGALLEGFRPRLRRMVALRLDPRLGRRVDCSDVLQEAFVDATRRLGEYRREKMPFFLWVRLITEQKVNELQRRHLGTKMRDVRREVSGGRAPDASTVCLARAIAQRGESPSHCASRHEQEGLLHAVLRRMKPQDSEILLLRHFEQLSNAECAEVLGLSVKTATTRHMRAARRLRELLSGRADLIGDVFETDGRQEEGA